MDVYAVFDLKVGQVLIPESVAKVEDRNTDAVNRRANIVEGLGLDVRRE